ncbi:MAG TPA: lysophospholipid acyltransferase family protein [Jatrophihabitans sp.]|nr:lysophospholipid acyltransferase family protein [Jatrophihabitans sp.]
MSRLHRPKAGFWIRAWVIILFPITTLLFRLRWRNLERVPAPDQGGVLIAINHLSHADTILMARVVWTSGRVPRFLIKAGVFDWAIIGRMMQGAGQIPVHRGTVDAAQSLHDAVTALERGEAVVIYPEGTTTKDPDNWPMLAKTGIARLVLACPDIPVVPVGQWGPHRMGGFSVKRLGRRRTSYASVGEPLDMSRFRGKEPSATLLREITDEVMTAVRDEVAALRDEQPPDAFYVRTPNHVDKQ